MRKLLFFGFVLCLRYANAQVTTSCCDTVATSLTSKPFDCISTSNVKVRGNIAINTLLPGGIAYNIYNRNDSTTFIGQYTGTDIFLFQNKIVKVYSAPYSVPTYYLKVKNYGNISLPDGNSNVIVLQPTPIGTYYVIDDACNVVCDWGWGTVQCIRAPCDFPPFISSSCQDNFLQTAIKIK